MILNRDVFIITATWHIFLTFQTILYNIKLCINIEIFGQDNEWYVPKGYWRHSENLDATF